MDTATQTPHRPLAFEVPDPPEQFGQDGTKFYRAYDALAEEIDDDMTSSLKEQLDGMLIFAGLFAGINSTFLALTIPLLSADPSSDTNALLARTNAILTELAMGRNNTVPGNLALPSTGFSPSGDVFAVNALFALSLAFAIISSFLAVLGRQWLVYYRKRSGGGPDRKRWEQLKRFLGAQRWRMELILDDVLPSLLQAGLFIFCISLIIYFHYLSPVLSIIVGVPLYVALAIFVASALCTLWDRFCPFHSPLSHLLSWSIRNAPSIQNFLVFSLRPLRPLATEFAEMLKRWTIQRHFNPRNNTENFHTSNEPASTIWLKCRDSIFSLPIKRWHQRSFKRREEESPESLQVIALQRTICTSDDPKSLLYATSNIFTITDAGQIDQLWSDNAFQERFLDQFRNSYTRMLQLRIRSQGNVAVAARQLYFCAAAHMMLCLRTSWRDYPGLMREVQKARETSVLSPGHGSSDSSTSMVRTTLGFALFQFSTYPPSDESIKRFHSHIIKYSDTLNRGDWRLLCVITWVIPNLRTLRFINDASIESLRRIYRGDVEQGITALERALNILVKRECEDLVECDRILTNMVRGINQIIIDDQTQLGITLRHKITLLEICERTMRSPRLGEAVKQGIRKMRRALAQVWQQEFTLWAVEFDIPARLLHMLEQYFATFRRIHQIDPAYHEYIDVLQAFGPPIRKLYTHEPLSEWVLDSLLKTCRKRISFRKTFNEFVLETDSISSQIQNNSGRIRDPDERWCHWNEEPLSMKALYYIFSDPPESGWNTLQRYLNPTNDSSNAT